MKKHIPNTLTCCNLISGCIATYFAFQSNYSTAFAFIILGAIFDFFDGFAARLLHVSSPVGKELVSLADDITFGFAPSAIVFSLIGSLLQQAQIGTDDTGTGLLSHPFVVNYLPYLAFLMAAFSALRLAKFNLDERQSTSFVGLPAPANALFWGSLIVGANDIIEYSPYCVFAIMAMVLISSYIQVAELPMFALKFKHWGWKGNEIKYIFIATCVPLLIIFKLSAFAVIIAWYVILSVYVNITNKEKDNNV